MIHIKSMPWLSAAAIIVLFVGAGTFGRVTGLWHNQNSNRKCRFHVRNIDLPLYQHNRGRAPACDMQAWLQMMRAIRSSEEKPHPAIPEPPPNNRVLLDTQRYYIEIKQLR